MLAVLKTLVDIALLRRDPSALPASSGVLLATIGAWAGIMILRGMVLADAQGTGEAGLPVVLFAVTVLLSLAWYRVVLIAFRKPERYLQMTTAIIGVECLIAAVTLPFVPALPVPGTTPPQLSAPLLLLLVSYLYGVYLMARIIAVTIEKSIGVGLLLWSGLALALWLLFGPTVGSVPAGS